jgi:hypothetical protein
MNPLPDPSAHAAYCTGNGFLAGKQPAACCGNRSDESAMGWGGLGNEKVEEETSYEEED